MTESDILRIFGLNTSKLVLGLSVWIPILLYVIRLSNLTNFLSSIGIVESFPESMISYLFILLLFLPSSVLGVLLGEFYDFLFYKNLKSTFNNRRDFTWRYYLYLLSIPLITSVTLISLGAIFESKFNVVWFMLFLVWEIVLITIFYFVFRKSSLSSENSKFNFFDFSYPWDSWDDPTLTKYRETLSTRFYLSAGIVASIPWIGIFLLQKVSGFSSVNLMPLSSHSDTDIRTPLLILIFLILLLILLLISLRQKIEKKEERSILLTIGSQINSKKSKEIRDRVKEKRQSINFTNIEGSNELRKRIEEYTEIYGYSFNSRQRLPIYLNLISIIHINLNASKRIKKSAEEYFPKNGKKSTGYGRFLTEEFELFLDATNQSYEELQKNNLDLAVFHLLLPFRRLIYIINGESSSASDYLEELSKDDSPNVRSIVASNPNTSEKVLNKLAVDKSEDVRQTVASNPNTSEKVLNKLAVDKSEDVRSVVAENPSTSWRVLDELAVDKSEDVRQTVAKNLKTPEEVLEKLANDRSEDVRQTVAKNLNTPKEVLEKLAKIEDENIRSIVVNNPETPVEVLEELVKDESVYVRCAVINNSNTPVEVLEELAIVDKRWEVLSAIARNPKTPVKVLKELANNKSAYVRRAIANNSNTPVEVLEELAKDESEDVRQTVDRNLNIFGEMLKEIEDESIRRIIANNPKTTVEVLEKLAEVEDENIRSIVANNSNTPVEVLEKLAKDESVYVRCAVINNSNTPVEVLMERAEVDKRWEVLSAVARNLNTPVEVLKELEEHENKNVRHAVANNPNTSREK